MQLPKFLMNILTEPDNSTFCPVRIVAIVGIIQYLGLTMAHYLQHAMFDAQSFAIGFAAIIGGVGAALGLKKDAQGVSNDNPK
jgi:hypothetical protein